MPERRRLPGHGVMLILGNSSGGFRRPHVTLGDSTTLKKKKKKKRRKKFIDDRAGDILKFSQHWLSNERVRLLALATPANVVGSATLAHAIAIPPI